MVAFHVDETLIIKLLGIYDRTVHVSEKFELISAAHVIAIARSAVRNNSPTVDLFNLARLERLNHPVLLGHAADPFV
jgi:hypothetical protein